MEPHLTVVAEMTARPGKEGDLRSTLLSLVEPTRREPGCVQYDLHESTDHPGTFVFFENWRSRQDLDEHLEMPHMRAFLSRSDALLAEPMRVVTYHRIR